MHRGLFVAHSRLEDRHWWFTARRRILRAVLHRIATPATGVGLVDLGCGTGGNAAALAGEYRVLGLDPSADAIELARERFRDVAFVQTDDPEAGREQLSNGGVLMMTDVLEHVADDADLFARALAIVPPGGHLLITVPADPALWSPHDPEFGHYRRYRLAELRALWAYAPVTERLVSAFNARLRPVIAFHRRLHRSRPTRPGGDLRTPVGPFNGVLRGIFAGEASALVNAIDTGAAPYDRGVSYIAVLRRQ